MFEEYAYLTLSLVLLGLFVGCLVLSPQRLRNSIVLSAFLSAPASFASLVFVPEYWHPNRIINFIIGPEDLIFSFSTGGIVWLMAIWLIRHKIVIKFDKNNIVRRYAILIVVGCIINLLLMMGMDIMYSTVITILIIGLWIIFRRSHYWEICISGLIGFTAFYFFFIKLSFQFFPNFIDQWNFENFYGLFIWGIPFEEIIWCMAYGCVWPLIIGYVLDARVSLIAKELS